IKPSVITNNEGTPIAKIEEGDVVFCFNFRTDRLREITTVFTQKDMPEFDMHTMPLHYLTMTTYDESFKNVHVVFENQVLEDTLGEVLAKNKKTQLRIAETEKYPHVSFFFSGGREEVFAGEDRLLVPSPKVATYDLKPAMSAVEVKEAVVEKLNEKHYDFICLNFANADMVGHTGVREAIIEALETVDKSLKEVVTTARKNDYSVVIIADHGNADYAINKDGSPNTAHSLNPVPCIIIDKNVSKLNNGSLCDVAPSLLKIMQLPNPEQMTGKALF
ncbi:MAG TPA: phosphoglycerate mutase (2,3-diphosphoglycerate-independent), partial [Bacteroidetes bacterium]|nr:phosphoglycerate mutase (2,3-diphosphoglycerate-independent) [Bacteroidota bacterium]